MVVFQNDRVEFARECEKHPAFRFAHRRASRVLKSRIGIDEPRTVTDQIAFEYIEVHAVVFDRHLENSSANATQRVDSAIIGGFLYYYRRTRRNKSSHR